MALVDAITLAAFMLYIALFVAFRWPPLIAVAAALALWVAAGIAFIAGGESLPQDLSLYALYLLASGVALLHIEHVRKSRKQRGEKTKAVT